MRAGLILLGVGTLRGAFARHKGNDRLPLGSPVWELCHEEVEDRAVEFLSLGDAEVEWLESHQSQACAGKQIHDAAGARVREGKVVRLDQHQRLLGGSGEGARGIEDAALGIRSCCENPESGRGLSRVCGCNHARFEINGLSLVFNKITERVADCLPAASHGGVIAHNRGHLGGGILTL